MTEPYKGTQVVKCPKCGKYEKVIQRAKDLSFYILKCEKYGEIKLTSDEKRLARRAYRNDMTGTLKTLTQHSRQKKGNSKKGNNE
jgi:ssDNA-binding Zn-finger/Zn-ribbon topoisomerase 1